ncbi:MAG: hypothetical protein EOQ56_27625 [Mesorhizobium sp.]|nr:MAG: hypothetical protein EOQ56_27625 [Mesorhizobium sp.]
MPLVASGALTITDVNDGLNARLTQDSFTVSTEADGSAGDYSLAVTTLSVLMGGVDTTSSWVVSAALSSGVSGSLVGSTYSVSNLLGDAGYVDLTASRAGYAPVVSRFSISKAKRGQAGGTLKLIASAPGFTFRNDVPDPISQTIALTAARTNTTDPVFWFASNGMTVRTDADEWGLRNYVVGLPGMGDGDTCYIDLAEFGDADELFITATCGDLTDVYNIQRVALATSGERGTVQVAAAIPGTVWTDAEAEEAILIAYNVTPRSGDVVTLYNSAAGFSQTRVLNSSGVWHQLAAFFGGDVLVNGTVSGTKLAASNVITQTAQIGDALITDAKIADLSAAKLQAGTALAGSLTVSGTALSTIDERAADPAARINLGPITKVDPGKVTVSGATTLADWRKAGDLTKIDGGAVSANTIDANKLTIGNRNIKFEGLQFEHNSPSANRVAWTSGVISYVGDDGNIFTRTITANNALWSTGTLYLYWVKDATTISSTTSIATAMGVNNVVLAAYKGNTDLVTDYGRTIIDGSNVKTGSIDTAQIKANAITAGLIAAGAINASHIQAQSIDVSKLTLNDATNLAPDNQIVTASAWSIGALWSLVNSTTYSFRSKGHFTYAWASGQTGYGASLVSAEFPVAQGEEYYFSYQTAAGAGDYNIRGRVQWLDAAAVEISTSEIFSGVVTATNTNPIEKKANFFAPANAKTAKILWDCERSTTTVVPSIGGVVARKRFGAELIVNGAITAEKLDVTTLSAITADMGTVTAGLLQSPDGKFIIDLTNGFIEILN